MISRVLDISERPAALKVRHRQLVVRSGETEHSVPVEEVAVLVAAHPAVTYTNSVLASLAEAGAVTIVCAPNYLPAAMLIPVAGNYEQAERYVLQAGMPQPKKKRLSQQIVRAKIRAQARTLRELHRPECGLETLIPRVRSGDPDNIEAQASRRYWPALFGRSFRRNPDLADQNRHLNYGYAVLRAITARAICAAGLHPTFGLHHRNRYDVFALADDFMEPYRSLVDRIVARWIEDHDPVAPLGPQGKAPIIEALTAHREAGGESRSLFDWLGQMSSSLVNVLHGRGTRLSIPQI